MNHNATPASVLAASNARLDMPRSAVHIRSPSTASRLLEWPLDIVLVLLDRCPPQVLAALARTCKALYAHSIPFLYKDLDLSFERLKTTFDGVNISSHDEARSYAARIQKACIRFLLRNPEVAKQMRYFKCTLGCFCDAQPDRELYHMLGLLENVEDVTIDVHPNGLYPVIEEDLSEYLFPKARSIKLSGTTTFYVLERIVLGCDKPYLEVLKLLPWRICQFPTELRTHSSHDDSLYSFFYIGANIHHRRFSPTMEVKFGNERTSKMHGKLRDEAESLTLGEMRDRWKRSRT